MSTAAAQPRLHGVAHDEAHAVAERGSTAHRRVIVSWSCDGSKRREVTFDRSVCEDGPEEVKPRSADEEGYVRALEIERAIQGLRLAASR